MNAEQWEAHWKQAWKSENVVDFNDPKWAVYNEIIRVVTERIKTHGNQVLLDFGCGAGSLLFRLRNIRGVTCIGFDISETAVGLCRARDLNVLHEDIADLAMDGTAGIVVATSVVDCATVLAGDVLRLMTSCCAPGGLVVLAVPEGETGDYSQRSTFDVESLSVLAANNGLEICSCRRIVSEGQPFVVLTAENANATD